MKKGNLFILLCLTVAGGVLTPIHSFSKTLGTMPADSLTMDAHEALYYNQRETSIRLHIGKMFPGTYLDSMGIVINLLSDSIRNELSITKVKDSAAYLKTCLNNALQDSILLERLGKLSMDEISSKHSSNVMLTAHCTDVSSSFPLDSVTMDIFSGNSLVSSAMSDSLGIIRLPTVAGGTYSVVFSRRGYTPASFTHIKLDGAMQSYMDVALNEQGGFLLQLVSKNILLSFVVIGILLLLTIIILAYFLARFMAKKKNKTVK